MQDLVATVKSRCQRISRLPLPRPLRANMASVMSIPKALYAPVGYGMNGDQERSVTTQLSIATSAGHLNNLEAREVEYVLHRHQHRHHYPTARMVALLQMAERHYNHDPVGCLMQIQTICDLANSKLRPLGTLTTLVWYARRMGMAVQPPYFLHMGTACQSLFWQTSGKGKKEWQHDIRESLRRMSLALLSSRRPQFPGTGDGPLPQAFPDQVSGQAL